MLGHQINLDGNAATHRGLRLLGKEDRRWSYVELRARRYLNNVVEQDHRAIKQRCVSTLGLKSFHSAAITFAGVELANRIRKRQYSLPMEVRRRKKSLKERWDCALGWSSELTAHDHDCSPSMPQISISRQLGQVRRGVRVEADVFPEIGHQPLEDLQASAFRDAVLKIERRGALDIAKRVLQTCGQIMRYAVAHDFASHNPVAGVKPSDILKPHKRRNFPRVDAKELPALLYAIDNYAGAAHTRLALQLMALTFVRTSELIGARWLEFDIDGARWDIPAERMKMKTPHIVALSKQSLEVLEKLREISFDRELVFPGDLKPAKPMSNNTLLFALYRLGYRGSMTGHGFRGVASTILHEQGWPHQHIELQLAHQERDDTSAAYNHAQYLEPRAKMMQALANYLDAARLKHVESEKKRAA